ncbi:sigma-54-dependent transcriptional regulator [Haliangium sp.]|uniref:sigma-54-dependent transcriptional regulator n=1 Tax=Haliangium sp. TaxID=2663208 RepID=UPI003D10F08A
MADYGHDELQPAVLVVDDEDGFHGIIKPLLEQHGFRVLQAYTGWECIEHLAEQQIDAVVLDLNLPDDNGFAVLENIRTEGDDAVVIVVSAYADPHSTERALNGGARMVMAKRFEEYIRLPEHLSRVMAQRRASRARMVAGAAPETGRGQWDATVATAADAVPIPLDPEVCSDRFARMEQSSNLDMRRLIHAARAMASLPTPALIEGAIGSDRELLARYLHHVRGGHGPFIAMPAAGSNGGAAALFGGGHSALTAATGGFLFIDQVHTLDRAGQESLLELLEEQRRTRERPSDHGACTPTSLRASVRVIAATTGRLDEVVRAGDFDVRLYERLATWRLHIPPLRHRLSELADEIEQLLEEIAETEGTEPPRLGPEACEALAQYGFPGNEKELRAMATLACVRKPGQVLGPDDIFLPTPAKPNRPT